MKLKINIDNDLITFARLGTNLNDQSHQPENWGCTIISLTIYGKGKMLLLNDEQTSARI